MSPSIEQQNLMPVIPETNAEIEAEEAGEMIVDHDVNAGLEEELPSSKKRSSPLKASSDNPRRKKQKRSKKKTLENVSDDKENNGRRPSPSNSQSNESMEAEIGNDFLAGRNKNEKNKPPEAGIITKIYAENFMCHKKMTVDLCRNVNFIYGQNGSGKSAILAAIQICLGAGARRTNRARSLKDLVRKDSSANCAKVRVTLLNKGSDAFQPEVYGDYITVERTIALRGGYNGYKLFSADNIEKSRAKKDLTEMLDKLNIQVENPVAILDQEEAKKFLTGKAEDKYNFFMKATELERLDNSYAQTLDKILEMDSQAERATESLKDDKELVKQLKRAYQQHQIIGQLEEKKSKFEVRLGWRNYKSELDELEVKVQKFEEFKVKAEKKKQDLTQAEAATQEMDDPNDERRTRLEALAKEAEEMATTKKELEQDLKREREPQKALARQFKLLKKEEERANRSLSEANQRLQAKRNEILAKAGSAESEEARRNQRLQAAEAKLAEEKNRHSELRQAVTDALKSYEDLEPEVIAARQAVSNLKGQLRGIEGKIRSMESSKGNSLDIFGPRCARVKQMVDRTTQQRKFRGPVLGPIGFFCKIQSGKENLASLAELAIGNGVLDRFIVFNDHDRKLFQQIRRDAGCQMDCGIFQQHQSPRYRVPEPPQGVDTVATVVSVQNDLVFNCLVDQAKIDTKALCRGKEESEQLLLVKDNSNRPAIRGGKIKEVYFLPKGDNWKVTGGMKNMISNTRRPKRTIGADVTAAIEDAKNDYQSVNDELKSTNNQYNRLEHEHTEFKKQWNANKRELRNNEREIDRASKEIDEVKAEEAASIDIIMDTTEEEEDVAAAQSDLDEIKENQRKAQDSMQEKLPQVQAIQDKVDEITARNEKILAEMKEAEDELSKYYQLIEHQKEKIAKKRRKLEQLEEIVSGHGQGIEKKQKEVDEYMEVAQRIQYTHERAAKKRQAREENSAVDDVQLSAEPTPEELEQIGVPNGIENLKDESFYTAKIKALEEQIEKEKERRLENKDDEATAFSKYSRAKEIYLGKCSQIKEIVSTSDQMKADTKLRRDRWEDYRETMCAMSHNGFDEVLNLKGSGGGIEFDHDDHTLNLIVQKDARNAQSQQADVKALSGGERSFTTIALLLAIGEMLETPFRVMDEFDVFLDPVTRKTVIDTLVDVGKEMNHRQFIFITPQDVSHLDSTPTLKILQMKPPERRTVAGGPEQQTLSFSSSQQ